jgi:hypothetical protein
MGKKYNKKGNAITLLLEEEFEDDTFSGLLDFSAFPGFSVGSLLSFEVFWDLSKMLIPKI